MILRQAAINLTEYGTLDFWMRQSLEALTEWIELIKEKQKNKPLLRAAYHIKSK